MTLKELGIGQKGIILSVGGSGALRQHFLDMGLIRGRRSDSRKICAYGRSDRVENTWV